jgi:putative spermidine/putrescine transport system permease protein
MKTSELYTTPLQQVSSILLYMFGGSVLLFLIAPILLVLPLAFSNDAYFYFPIKNYSLRWFQDLFSDPVWIRAIYNSIFIATLAGLLATALGTLAAVGLNQYKLLGKRFIMSVLILPLIVPHVVLAVGVYFFFSKLGIANSILGIVLIHAVIGTPFVVITVTATLSGFDIKLMQAAQGLGATTWTALRHVMLPAIWPGILSGAVFAFASSFDEAIIVLFLGGPEQTTLPRQMMSGLREHLSPTILAAAFILILTSVGMLLPATLRRYKSIKYDGITR